MLSHRSNVNVGGERLIDALHCSGLRKGKLTTDKVNVLLGALYVCRINQWILY